MDAAAVIASSMTISGKIRALDRLGYPRAEIARLLERRYQQVRNVLEADRTAASRGGVATQGVAESSSPFEAASPGLSVEDVTGPDQVPTFRLQVTDRGEIRLPPEAMAQLHIHAGGVAIAEIRDGAFVVLSVEETIRRIQAWAQTFATPGVSWADELIAERRAEATREASE